MDLKNAEIAVTTQHLIDIGDPIGEWFLLSDYNDIEEFYAACSEFFSNEENPEFRFAQWENIPEKLIKKDWLSPNFFELKDALERLDESELDYFESWCQYHNYNLAEDDPYVLVSHFQDMHCTGNDYKNDDDDWNESDSEIKNIADDYFGIGKYSIEIFDDNYN